MIDYLKDLVWKIVISTAIGYMLYSLSKSLQSDYIDKFIIDNLITLLVALLAINTTTISVILTKLYEITKQYKGIDFNRSIHEMRTSITEQVVLIALSAVALILKTSVKLNQMYSYSDLVVGVALLALFVFAIQILYDTANGVFIILRFEADIVKVEEKIEGVVIKETSIKSSKTKKVKR